MLEGLFKKRDSISGQNEVTPVIPHEIYNAGILRLQDIIAPSALQINSNHIKLGEKVARVLFAMSYPRYLSMNWFAPIINLDKVFDISIFVHPVDTTTVLRQHQ